jgi:gliding motility-associated-like protein
MKRLLLLIPVLLLGLQAWATHNRAGEIIVEQIGPLRFRATIITYTVPDSPADRPELEIRWGDGTIDTLPRSNNAGNGVEIEPGVKRNEYVGEHTYESLGFYIISMLDPNRNGGILNMDDSVNTPFYIETQIVITQLGYNSSPNLLNPPIDKACVNRRYEHNPGAWDPNGDSLSYELVTCQMDVGVPVGGYVFPPGISLDPITGDLVWEVPTVQGEYNFAIRINEWRYEPDFGSYSLIGYVIRDMQVTVLPCQNNPPIIETIDEICVEAGDSVRFWVKAWDPDHDPVSLSAVGGPFQQPISPAYFENDFDPDTAKSEFQWLTHCSHVQLMPYTVVFRAEDSPPLTQEPLTDYHTVFITVVGPAPQNPQAAPIGNSIQLNWDASVCSEVVGYKIYRRIEEYGFVPDTCETGVPGYTGYSYLASTQDLNGTAYLDDTGGAGLARGVQYCYMVVACFPDGAQSYASVEFCAELKKDVPVITNVSVEGTSTTDGLMYVAWSKPTELDMVQTPGPFEYRVYRSSLQDANETLVETYFDLNDTTFNDDGLNTKEIEYIYRIELFNATAGNSFVVGSSESAHSVFLTAIGLDNMVQLSWTEVVPWLNDTFEIYRQNAALDFVLIGLTDQTSYTDTGLANGIERCYKVRSSGRYSSPSYIDPILNWSQETCAIPTDTTPPCDQVVDIDRDCENYRNTLTWSDPSVDCPNDIVEFRVMYTPVFGGELTQIAAFTAPFQPGLEFVHDELLSVAGCYAVVAVDSFMNISLADTFCVDNCPEYELPNVFTPGGDDVNDLFTPFPWRYVQDVELRIYDRWGLLMFETTDPDINWDGTSKQSKLPSADGVYYYVCTVNEVRLHGITPRTLTGFFHLLRQNTPGAN